MKLYSTILIVFIISISCKSQENSTKTELSYVAQTRGYHLTINLKENTLEISENNNISKKVLTNKKLAELQKIISEIDFSKLKNNLSAENVAVDKAIPANFKLKLNEADYNFEFEHNNLPKGIENLINTLQEFVLLKE
ncbi:hypothetical protein [Lutibacter sp. B1]|uniref:hypothetical protein n=1 Tax=Lutibacter sp. B1 TaxID=2725996 RepID=UPI00145719DD|nr:hypothetical protein [Lutibacter sp. B1]NLP57137.1 hypothetical protein [Lutibacter sp. B1]